MANSSITGGRDVIQSHGSPGTAELGPSDTSDSGSDTEGSSGMAGEELDGLDRFSDVDTGRGMGAGADIGDANLDSDSDSSGTGERAGAGGVGGPVDRPRAALSSRAGRAGLLAMPLAFLALFFVFPLVSILDRGLRPDGALDPGAVLDVLARPRTGRVLWFTVWTSAVATLLAVGLGMGVVVGGNLWLAYRLRPKLRPHSAEQATLERYRMLLGPRIRTWIALVALLVAFFAGLFVPFIINLLFWPVRRTFEN